MQCTTSQMWQWVWIRRRRWSSFCFNMIDKGAPSPSRIAARGIAGTRASQRERGSQRAEQMQILLQEFYVKMRLWINHVWWERPLANYDQYQLPLHPIQHFLLRCYIHLIDDPVSSGAQTNPTVYLKIQIVDINIDLRERHRALGHNSSSPLNQPPISCMVGEQWSKYTIGMVDWLGHSMQLSIPRWLSKNLPDQPSIGNPGQCWLVHHMPPF